MAAALLVCQGGSRKGARFRIGARAARGPGGNGGGPGRRTRGRGRERAAVRRAHPPRRRSDRGDDAVDTRKRKGTGVNRVDPEVLDGVLDMLRELAGDWEYDGEITPDTSFLGDLGLESLDIVVLGTLVQQRYGRLPFAEYLEELGQR